MAPRKRKSEDDDNGPPPKRQTRQTASREAEAEAAEQSRSRRRTTPSTRTTRRPAVTSPNVTSSANTSSGNTSSANAASVTSGSNRKHQDQSSRQPNALGSASETDTRGSISDSVRPGLDAVRREFDVDDLMGESTGSDSPRPLAITNSGTTLPGPFLLPDGSADREPTPSPLPGDEEQMTVDDHQLDEDVGDDNTPYSEINKLLREMHECRLHRV